MGGSDRPRSTARRITVDAGCPPSESEFAYDPYAEQDLTPYERHYYEDHAYDPEREQ